MFSPGQLVRHQRNRRGWTQRQLARSCGVGQSLLSSYETGEREPTWPQLCRILAVMGVQPRVLAQACDLGQHAATALVRRTSDDLGYDTYLQSLREAASIEPTDLVRPDLTHAPLNMRDIRPACELVKGLPHVFTGPFALRAHGIACSVAAIEVIVDGRQTAALDGQLAGDQPPGHAGRHLWGKLTDNLYRAGVQIWCPIRACYLNSPDEMEVRAIARQTGDAPTFRTRETATEIRMRVTTSPLPVHVLQLMRDVQVPLLALSELHSDTRLAPIIQRFSQDLS